MNLILRIFFHLLLFLLECNSLILLPLNLKHTFILFLFVKKKKYSSMKAISSVYLRKCVK